jgi:hypothetical protein
MLSRSPPVRYQANEHVARAGEMTEVEGCGGAGITFGACPEAFAIALRNDRGADITTYADVIVRCGHHGDGPAGEDVARDMRAARSD